MLQIILAKKRSTSISDKIIDFSRGTIKRLLDDESLMPRSNLRTGLELKWKRLDKMCTVILV
jgi:hypothetical protein